LKVVVDTVVFVRALINPNSIWGRVLGRAPEYTLVTTDAIRAEVLRVVARPELRSRFTRMKPLPPIERAIEYLSLALAVPDGPLVSVCRDPNDDKFFACARSGRADYIVSEDEDILAIPEYSGARTIRAAEFLRILDATRQR
jgi:putative PIN family toxin of toxin-antitoxin system